MEFFKLNLKKKKEKKRTPLSPHVFSFLLDQLLTWIPFSKSNSSVQLSLPLSVRWGGKWRLTEVGHDPPPQYPHIPLGQITPRTHGTLLRCERETESKDRNISLGLPDWRRFFLDPVCKGSLQENILEKKSQTTSWYDQLDEMSSFPSSEPVETTASSWPAAVTRLRAN